jgi:hypothetical protein
MRRSGVRSSSPPPGMLKKQRTTSRDVVRCFALEGSIARTMCGKFVAGRLSCNAEAQWKNGAMAISNAYTIMGMVALSGAAISLASGESRRDDAR